MNESDGCIIKKTLRILLSLSTLSIGIFTSLKIINQKNNINNDIKAIASSSIISNQQVHVGPSSPKSSTPQWSDYYGDRQEMTDLGASTPDVLYPKLKYNGKSEIAVIDGSDNLSSDPINEGMFNPNNVMNPYSSQMYFDDNNDFIYLMTNNGLLKIDPYSSGAGATGGKNNIEIIPVGDRDEIKTVSASDYLKTLVFPVHSGLVSHDGTLLPVKGTNKMYVPTIDGWRIYDPSTDSYTWMSPTQHQNTPKGHSSSTRAAGWNADQGGIWEFGGQIYAQMSNSVDPNKTGIWKYDKAKQEFTEQIPNSIYSSRPIDVNSPASIYQASRYIHLFQTPQGEILLRNMAKTYVYDPKTNVTKEIANGTTWEEPLFVIIEGKVQQVSSWNDWETYNPIKRAWEPNTTLASTYSNISKLALIKHTHHDILTYLPNGIMISPATVHGWAYNVEGMYLDTNDLTDPYAARHKFKIGRTPAELNVNTTSISNSALLGNPDRFVFNPKNGDMFSLPWVRDPAFYNSTTDYFKYYSTYSEFFLKWNANPSKKIGVFQKNKFMQDFANEDNWDALSTMISNQTGYEIKYRKLGSSVYKTFEPNSFKNLIKTDPGTYEFDIATPTETSTFEVNGVDTLKKVFVGGDVKIINATLAKQPYLNKTRDGEVEFTISPDFDETTMEIISTGDGDLGAFDSRTNTIKVLNLLQNEIAAIQIRSISSFASWSQSHDLTATFNVGPSQYIDEVTKQPSFSRTDSKIHEVSWKYAKDGFVDYFVYDFDPNAMVVINKGKGSVGKYTPISEKDPSLGGTIRVDNLASGDSSKIEIILKNGYVWKVKPKNLDGIAFSLKVNNYLPPWFLTIVILPSTIIGLAAIYWINISKKRLVKSL